MDPGQSGQQYREAGIRRHRRFQQERLRRFMVQAQVGFPQLRRSPEQKDEEVPQGSQRLAQRRQSLPPEELPGIRSGREHLVHHLQA